MTNILKSNLFRHIVIWICLTLYISIPAISTGVNGYLLLYLLVLILDLILAYYVLLYYVFYKGFERSKVVFIFGYLSVVVFFVAIRFFDDRIVARLYSGPNYASQPFIVTLISALFNFSFIAFVTLGSFLNWKSIQRIKQNAEKEKNIISRELGFLKNQFHSHLTFNFLNFCYGKMLRYAPQSAESVESFSEMLRYSLVSKELENYVPLAKEVEYIENFIAIQKCISSQVFVNLSIRGEVNHLKILPMLLSIFVENAFKHGIFNAPDKPIEIHFLSENNTLYLSVKNYKTNKTAINSTGIGLKNIKQLLKLFYSEKYSLVTNETDIIYDTELSLILETIA